MPATPPEMSAAAAPPERILNPEFVKLFAAFHFFMLGMSVFNLLPHYLELRGASEGKYGAVAGTLGVVNFFCIVVWGHQADRWSRKTTVVFYLLLGLAGNAVAILAMDAPLNWYFLSRAFQGITMGLGLPIIFVWTFEVSPPARKQEALAWIGIAGLTANSLGPLLAELILSVQGSPPVHAEWYFPVFLTATGLMLVAQLLFLSVRNTRAAGGETAGETSLWPLVRRRHAGLILLVAVIFGGVFGVMVSFAKNFLVFLGLNFASVLFGAYSSGAILSRIFIRTLIHRLTPARMVPFGLAGIAIGILLIGFSTNYAMLAGSGLVYGLSHGILYPILFVRFVESQPPEHLGRAAILFMGSFSGGWGLFPYLGGVVLQWTSFPTLFFIMSGFAVLALFIYRRTLQDAPAAG
ncbi:MAG: MFS transporter [SAR324 cluster bacterium]|nr:MFS transporter [SAR324 cluster bacterium]